MARLIVQGRGRHGPSVKLQADDNAAENLPPEGFPHEGARWIQIAAAGEFKGHPAGDFTFDAKTFGEIIANFRAHPSFEADPGTSLGMGDVVAYDFHHASEEPAATVGVMGAPAQAWAMDLQTRPGETGLELWALTRYLEPARSFIQAGKYKWTSVAVWPNATNPNTGEDVGWYMSSIAFTNDPFIQGMAPITAERAGRVVKLNREVLFDEIKTWVLGLPATATMQEVVTELAKLRAIAVPGAPPPPGVDVYGLLQRLQSLLNLPVLADADLVFAEVDKLMGVLTAAAPPMPVEEPAPIAQGLQAPKRAPNKERMKSLLIKLGRHVGIEVPPDADDTKQAVLADRILNALRLEKEEGTGVKAGLTALLKALGVEDAEGGVARVAEMMEASKTLADFMPQLAELQGAAIKNQEDEEMEDIEATMASRGYGPELRPMLLRERRGGVLLSVDMTPGDFAKGLSGRKVARTAYLQAFPVPTTPATPAYLHQNIATSPAATILSRLATTSNGRVAMAAPGPQGGAGSVNLAEYEGANDVQRAMAHIKAQPGGDKLTFDQVHSRGVMLARQCRASA